MPYLRYYRGREIKRTKRITMPNGSTYIRIIYRELPNKPGSREVVSESVYRSGRITKYEPPKNKSLSTASS